MKRSAVAAARCALTLPMAGCGAGSSSGRNGSVKGDFGASGAREGCFVHEGTSINPEQFQEAVNDRQHRLYIGAQEAGLSGEIMGGDGTDTEPGGLALEYIPYVPEGGMANYTRWRCENLIYSRATIGSFGQLVELQRAQQKSTGVNDNQTNEPNPESASHAKSEIFSPATLTKLIGATRHLCPSD